jgi:hypothetical protein
MIKNTGSHIGDEDALDRMFHRGIVQSGQRCRLQDIKQPALGSAEDRHPTTDYIDIAQPVLPHFHAEVEFHYLKQRSPRVSSVSAPFSR